MQHRDIAILWSHIAINTPQLLTEYNEWKISEDWKMFWKTTTTEKTQEAEEDSSISTTNEATDSPSSSPLPSTTIAQSDTSIDLSDEECGSEDNARLPSDLTIDHHPRRTSQYTIAHRGSTSVSSFSDEGWYVGEHSISSLCFNFKQKTLDIAKASQLSRLSDVRLLVLNDITMAINDLRKLSFLFASYYLPKSHQCYTRCKNIEISPLQTGCHHWHYALKCSRMLAKVETFWICTLLKFSTTY